MENGLKVYIKKFNQENLHIHFFLNCKVEVLMNERYSTHVNNFWNNLIVVDQNVFVNN